MADDTTPFYRCSTYTIDPTSSDDITQGFKAGSRWVNTATNRAFLCTNPTASHAMWICSTVPTAMIDIISANFSTASTTYQTALTLPYVYMQESTWDEVKVIAATNSATATDTFDFRVIDITNGNAVIAESTGLYSATKQIYDLGTMSNLPDGQSIFELQVRNSGTSAGAIVTLYSATVINY